jgi:hypothetical protein
MTHRQRDVASVSDLLEAANDPCIHRIDVVASLHDVPNFRLSPGQTLSGAKGDIAIQFESGGNGVELSADNTVEHLTLVADAYKAAVCNDTRVDGLGRLVLRHLRVCGRVELIAQYNVRTGHIDVHDVDIVQADARGEEDRPKGYGVEVIPGAFTLWNKHPDPAVAITTDITGLSVGRTGAPVWGTGVFVSGAGEKGGKLMVQRLETGAVHSNGGIAKGTADRIAAGIFVVYGAVVDSVRNEGPVTTYGPNDMVLDNWGTVDQWVACKPVTSHGPSAIGFVNFGTIDFLQIDAPIETFGKGSRGFNVYAGTVRHAYFDQIVTHADGAVGIQISQPVGTITVHRGIETFGGTGDSLVKGVVVKLAANPLSIKKGGSVQVFRLDGGITAHGEGVVALDLQGSIQSFQVSGGMCSEGI